MKGAPLNFFLGMVYIFLLQKISPKQSALHTFLHLHLQWNQGVKLQSEGTPIGLEIAGTLAKVVMLWWDKKFLKKAAINNILLYLYV